MPARDLPQDFVAWVAQGGISVRDSLSDAEVVNGEHVHALEASTSAAFRLSIVLYRFDRDEAVDQSSSPIAPAISREGTRPEIEAFRDGSDRRDLGGREAAGPKRIEVGSKNVLRRGKQSSRAYRFEPCDDGVARLGSELLVGDCSDQCLIRLTCRLWIVEARSDMLDQNQPSRRPSCEGIRQIFCSEQVCPLRM